jgi:hypothetical protein
MEAVKEYQVPNKPPREWTIGEKKEAAEYLASRKTVKELRKRIAGYGEQRAMAYECVKQRSNTLANLEVMEHIDLLAITIVESR